MSAARRYTKKARRLRDEHVSGPPTEGSASIAGIISLRQPTNLRFATKEGFGRECGAKLICLPFRGGATCVLGFMSKTPKQQDAGSGGESAATRLRRRVVRNERWR